MPFFKQQLVVFFHQRGKGNALVGPVQMRNFAITEAEAVGCGVGDKRNPVVFVPGGSSGKAVEHGFPHMAEAFVHQRDFQPAGAAERVARRVARARPATPPPIITSRNLFVISFLSFVSPFWPEGEAVLRYVVFVPLRGGPAVAGVGAVLRGSGCAGQVQQPDHPIFGAKAQCAAIRAISQCGNRASLPQ